MDETGKFSVLWHGQIQYCDNIAKFC
jgi:hypothetical protein